MKNVLLLKCTTIFLSFNLLMLLFSPTILRVDAQEGVYSDDFNINLLIENEEYLKYQTTEDNIVYETEEYINNDVINTKKYKIDGSLRTLVQNDTTTLSKTSTDVIIEVKNNLTNQTTIASVSLSETPTPIGDNNDVMPPSPLEYSISKPVTLQTTSQNSYDSDAYSTYGYTAFTGSYIMGLSYAKNYTTKKGIAKQGVTQKTVSIPNASFDKFTSGVNSMRSDEKGVLIDAVGIGFVQQIAYTFKKGVSLATLKKVFLKAGKSIPYLGTLYTIIKYIYTYDKTLKAYIAINVPETHNGWGDAWLK